MTITTPSSSTHAIFRPSTPPIAFGVEGELNSAVVTQLIDAIESSTVPSDSFQSVDLPSSVNGFDKLVAVMGMERHFLCGWPIDQPDMIHLIPTFSCELDPTGCFPYQRLSRYVNLFELTRQPEPYFQFKMRGGKSQLSVTRWGYARLQELKTYVGILKRENGAELRIKNRKGDILVFPTDSGWDNVDNMVSSHIHMDG